MSTLPLDWQEPAQPKLEHLTRIPPWAHFFIPGVAYMHGTERHTYSGTPSLLRILWVWETVICRGQPWTNGALCMFLSFTTLYSYKLLIKSQSRDPYAQQSKLNILLRISHFLNRAWLAINMMYGMWHNIIQGNVPVWLEMIQWKDGPGNSFGWLETQHYRRN